MKTKLSLRTYTNEDFSKGIKISKTSDNNNEKFDEDIDGDEEDDDEDDDESVSDAAEEEVTH